MGRVVVAGVAHHVTQRGNRRQQTFFCQEDYGAYLALLREWAPRSGVEVWAYCLMPNHVHLVLVPHEVDALRRSISQVHRRYTRMVNFRERWRGHLWQARFASFPMDESHMLRSIPYVLANPVRANLARRPEEWGPSSIHGHLGTRPDPILTPSFVDGFVREWVRREEWGCDSDVGMVLANHARTGRPLGSSTFIHAMEQQTCRTLTPPRRGRPPRAGKKE